MTDTPPPTQDDLAAGRELDAEVATHVFGWRDCEWDGWSWLGTLPDGTERWPIPAYSTEISAAWQVLAGWSVTLAHAEGLRWHCRLMRCTREGEWQNGEGHADTAPMAICKAALAAVR
jgi:hypothetical protein